MTYTSSANFNVNTENLTILCVHVRSYRMFQSFTLSLDPRFHAEIEMGGMPEIKIRSIDYLDLYPELKLNIKLICGKNGVGKSTLLELVSGEFLRNDNSGFVLMFDQNNNFLSTEPCNVTFDGSRQLVNHPYLPEFSYRSVVNANRIFRSDDQFHFHKQIWDFYFKERKLFDFGDTKLFSHFSYDFWNGDGFFENLENHLREKFGITLLPYNILNSCKGKIISFLFIVVSQDNSFDSLVGELRQNELKFEFDDLLKIIDSKIISIIGEKEFKKVNYRLNKFLEKTYEFDEYINTKNELITLSKEVDLLLKRISGNREIHEPVLIRYLYPKPFLQLEKNQNRRYVTDLSTGEYQVTRLKYQLLPRMLQKNGVFFAEDDADADLHPEWSRRYIFDFLQAFKSVRKHLMNNYKDSIQTYKNKRYTVLLTTHSPFLLTDLQTENVIYLEKQINGLVFERKTYNKIFGGNIGELFFTNFFMDGTIGEFSKQFIEKIIKEIKKPISKKRKSEIIRVIDRFGDLIIKNILLGMIERSKNLETD